MNHSEMKKTILLIEDYPNAVEVLKTRLENAGYRVLVAFDGSEGLRMAREQRPDLIILDILLPKMNGYKVSRLLKFDAKYRHIPIIMLTSRTRPADYELGKQTGADEYVTKPYNPHHLMALVQKYLFEQQGPSAPKSETKNHPSVQSGHDH